MAIPIATHRITVEHPGEPTGWGEADGPATQLATDVRAVLGSPSGSESRPSETLGDVVFRLTADPVPGIDRDCEVVDQATGHRYSVVWVVERPSIIGEGHIEGGLRRATGGQVA